MDDVEFLFALLLFSWEFVDSFDLFVRLRGRDVVVDNCPASRELRGLLGESV